MRMKLSKVVELVNSGNALYKFSKNGDVFSGLNEFSFTPDELDSNANGFLKKKNGLFFRKLK